MKTLKVGDVRQTGDQQREKDWVNNPNAYCGITREPKREWFLCCLVGHPILASDLMHLEFRRP